MSVMVKILKSDDLEARERHVERLKKNISHLNETLEINLEALDRLRNRTE
jgi:hypothetical protein